jgi:hypothetical protein
MSGASQRLAAVAVARLDAVARGLRGQRGQATVEYVGLVIVLGTGIGMVVAGLDTLGFVAKVGGKLIRGITGALDKIMP